MDVDSDLILGWARMAVLILCMAWAAWFDHKERKVSNEHWIVWTKPIVFIWTLDLLMQQPHWSVWLTASALLAYASGSVVGRPTLRDVRAGNRLDQIVLVWYLLSVIGIIAAGFRFASTSPLDVLVGDASPDATLWWSYVGALFTILIIDLAWRLRFIHGGADAKALMWVTLLFPSWSSVPVFYTSAMDEAVLHLPPSLSLLIWGGFLFILIPFVLFFRNIVSGSVKSFSDLTMAWMALCVPLKEVRERHVWLLTDTMEMPNGEIVLSHRRRAPRRTPTDVQMNEHIERLETFGAERIWVSLKLPLLLFLFPAIVPLWLIGDPMAALLPLILR
ncbi:MAG: hypothetical protein CMA16_01770 [Euryarchaeota archaeon]|nr:hypothetical protein [Euryarchaeota archaeon]